MREYSLQWRRDFWADAESISGYFQGLGADIPDELSHEWHILISKSG